jgi:formate-dependent nitrite reductase membrane component NrfD
VADSPPPRTATDQPTVQIPDWMRATPPQNPRPNDVRFPRTQSPLSPDAVQQPSGTFQTRTPSSIGNPQSASGDSPEPSYYDISLLKAPVWRWEIASYFFLGGLSAGSYILSRMAHRFGGPAFKDVSKVGAFTALGALIPSPPLLIHDLGDPKRFHHMLRVWKPSSPMNLGTWVLNAYCGPATLTALHEWADSRPAGEREAFKKLTNPFVMAVSDAAGVPLALVLAGYTGVLLSSTANPLWSRNPWIGPLFSASAIGTGAAAISLALRLTGAREHSGALKVLDHVDTAAHAAEAACAAGFLKHAGENAAPLLTGKQAPTFKATGAAAVASEVLKFLPLRGKAKRVANVASNVLSLAAGFGLRWSFVHGAHEAANDPRLARLATGTPKRQTLPPSGKDALPSPSKGTQPTPAQGRPTLPGDPSHGTPIVP